MTKRNIALVVFSMLVVVLACGYYYKPIYDLKEAVKNELVDPDSAKFKDIYVNRKTKVGCGQVNSKNKMGGYAGSRFFIVYANGRVVFDDPSWKDPLDQGKNFADVLVAICQSD